MGAFLSGLFNQIGPRLEEKHQQELELQKQRKQSEFNTYWGSMQAAATRLSQLKAKGQLTPEEEQEAQRLAGQYAWSEQQLNKTTKSSKPLAEGFQKVGAFVKQILTRPSPKGQLQAPQQQGTFNPQSPGGTSGFAGPVGKGPLQPPAQPPQEPQLQGRLQPPPQQGSMQGAMALAAQGAQSQTPEGRKAEQANIDRERRKTEVDPSWTSQQKAEFIETAKIPASPASATRKDAKFKLKDGSEVDVQYDPKTGTYYDLKNEPFEVPEGAERVAAKSSTARPTIIATDYVNIDDAKKLKDQGMPFLGVDGKELDLEKVPKGMVLQKVHYADGRTLYEPRNQNDRIVKVGGHEYAVNPSQVQQLPQGAGTDLGVSNTPTNTVREVPAVDAKGNPIAQKLQTTRTPQTPGIAGRPTQTQENRGNQVAQPQPIPSPSGAPQRRNVDGGSPGASSQYRPLPGMTPGAFNNALNRITPVREAATQIFGDPSQPNVKSMVDFAHLADDPKSRERIGKALNVTFNEMENLAGGAHVGVGVGPLSIGGNFGSWIGNAFGLPAKVAQQMNEITQKAITDLTPQEREAYDATMSTFATMVGLRSLTKASAAQASVRSIENEIPTIGRFTVSKDQYVDRLQHIAEIVYNGTKGIPEAMWHQTPQMYDYITGLPDKMQSLKNSSKPSPKGKLQAPAKVIKEWDPKSKTFIDVKVQ